MPFTAVGTRGLRWQVRRSSRPLFPGEQARNGGAEKDHHDRSDQHASNEQEDTRTNPHRRRKEADKAEDEDPDRNDGRARKEQGHAGSHGRKAALFARRAFTLAARPYAPSLFCRAITRLGAS